MKLSTPICDFVRRYAETDPLRLHIPGHKGMGAAEHRLDITEIDGADSLYEANGIIQESEENASVLFGVDTFYSTEGSSHCIRAMLALAIRHAREAGKRPVIAAGRNAHKVFLTAMALLDVDILWLYPQNEANYLSCPLQASELELALRTSHKRPTALYLTSPDYLGNILDIASLAEVCHRHGMLLLVDCAHGAYLKFLPRSRFPIDLGADLCCTSAHKTLPVLTGGAYLHIGRAHENLSAEAKQALALFGSTSPSYLILRSLDAANAYLADGYRERLSAFCEAVTACRQHLSAHGLVSVGEEPLKLTLCPKSYGYTGTVLAARLAAQHILCEFADPDCVVLMLTPELGTEGLWRLEQALLSIPPLPPIQQTPPRIAWAERVLPVRDALLSPSETVSVRDCVGRILASPSVGCPPAVPIAVCGERLTPAAAAAFAYYGISSVSVVK